MADIDKIHALTRAVIIDQDHILLCQTQDLPLNFYFLPGGHIEHGESAKQALVRELLEESGAKVEIKKFLGCFEYSFKPGHNSVCHNHEYNFIFEAESDKLKIDIDIVQIEKHIKLLWMPLGNLNDIDLRAEPFKRLIPKWLELNAEDFFESKMI